MDRQDSLSRGRSQSRRGSGDETARDEDGVPMDHQHLWARVKSWRTTDYWKTTAYLLVKWSKWRANYGEDEAQKYQPQTNGYRKSQKKRKESEPYIDISGLEKEKSQTESDEDTATTKRWLTEAMKQLKERTDDVSEVEQSLTKVKMDMANMNENLNKVADAITKMTKTTTQGITSLKNLWKGLAMECKNGTER